LQTLRMGNDAYFPGATFEGGAAFERVQIMGAALFSSQSGGGASNLTQPAHFLHNTSFSGSHFGSGVRFSGVRFDEKADFAGARFEGDAHFEDSVFSGPSSFRSVAFKAVYFSAAETGGKQPFQNDVDLLGCTYERIQIDWRSLLRYPNGQPRFHPYDRQPYIELEGVLRKSGSDEDADAVYAERRRAENENMKGWRKLGDYIYSLFANYGIGLLHEFIWSLLFLGIGMLLFARPRAVLIGSGESGAETKISWYQALPLAIHQFLPFGLPAKPRWTPSENILFSFLPWPFRKAASYANFLHFVGWILIPLAAAVLTGFLRHGAQ
jgi:Pentapeptide repeats (9 copies)